MAINLTGSWCEVTTKVKQDFYIEPLIQDKATVIIGAHT
jgi:hypothetical protein